MTSLSQIDPNLRPAQLEIDLGRLRHNLRQIKSQVAPAKVLATVKANAYGHGMLECAKVLLDCGVDYLGVALLIEALELRRAGINAPVLVFGGILGEQVSAFIENDLDLTASSISKLEMIDAVALKVGKKARVHLKIDTGMERIGVHYYSAKPFLEAAAKTRHTEIVGIFSHFANADQPDLSLTNIQLERFLEVCQLLQQSSDRPIIRHIANSAAILQCPASYLDMVRPGLILYGAYPNQALNGRIDLLPVLSLRSKVVYFKVVKKGCGISYGHSYITDKDMRMVTVPVGYGDGYHRALSNHASVLIRGQRFRIRGKICMDQMMVEIGDQEAYNGDEVVLIGKQNAESITVEELAALAGTAPHDILAMLNLRLPRVYKSGM